MSKSEAIMKHQLWVGRRNSWGTKAELQGFLAGRGHDFHVIDIGYDSGVLICKELLKF